MYNLAFILLSLSLCCFSLTKAEKKAPVLLVSFDGLRDDKLDSFLEQNPSSNFKKFIDSGVHADFMIPSFPSATFPNHWTIVTGIANQKLFKIFFIINIIFLFIIKLKTYKKKLYIYIYL